jgi:hypothetical protein
VRRGYGGTWFDAGFVGDASIVNSDECVHTVDAA